MTTQVINDLKNICMFGILSDDAPKIHKTPTNTYVSINKYVLPANLFIAAVIFCDTIKESDWSRYSFLVEGGDLLYQKINELWTELEILPEKCDNSKELLNHITKLIYQAELPESVLLANKHDKFVAIMEYLTYLEETI